MLAELIAEHELSHLVLEAKPTNNVSIYYFLLSKQTSGLAHL